LRPQQWSFDVAERAAEHWSEHWALKSAFLYAIWSSQCLSIFGAFRRAEWRSFLCPFISAFYASDSTAVDASHAGTSGDAVIGAVFAAVRRSEW